MSPNQELISDRHPPLKPFRCTSQRFVSHLPIKMCTGDVSKIHLSFILSVYYTECVDLNIRKKVIWTNVNTARLWIYTITQSQNESYSLVQKCAERDQRVLFTLPNLLLNLLEPVLVFCVPRSATPWLLSLVWTRRWSYCLSGRSGSPMAPWALARKVTPRSRRVRTGVFQNKKHTNPSKADHSYECHSLLCCLVLSKANRPIPAPLI